MPTYEYLESHAGRRHGYCARYRRRIRLSIEGVEPRGKPSARLADQLAIQRGVLDQLVALRRGAFRGPVVVSLSVQTASKVPSHLHSIAKNLLDLLGAPLRELGVLRKGLLFHDDGQVQGLSVSCAHGSEHPSVRVEARSFRDFLCDLDLLVHALEADGSRSTKDSPSGGLSTMLGELLDHEAECRAVYGDDTYSALLDMARQDAQRELLSVARFGPRLLSHLYGATGGGPRRLPGARETIAAISAKLIPSPLHITLPELPTSPGTSQAYKTAAERAVTDFRQKLRRTLTPLRVPIALEVIVKPARSAGVTHDLDNLMRSYILPAVLKQLTPPSTVAWTVALPASERRDSTTLGPVRRLVESQPPSTKVGLTHFEVWRLNRSSGDHGPGFVDIAIVDNSSGRQSSLSEIDTIIDRWSDTID